MHGNFGGGRQGDERQLSPRAMTNVLGAPGLTSEVHEPFVWAKTTWLVFGICPSAMRHLYGIEEIERYPKHCRQMKTDRVKKRLIGNGAD